MLKIIINRILRETKKDICELGITNINNIKIVKLYLKNVRSQKETKPAGIRKENLGALKTILLTNLELTKFGKKNTDLKKIL